MFRGTEYNVDFVPKIKIEVVVSDDKVRIVVDMVIKASRTGQVADGKIFIMDLAETVRMRNRETGEEAL